MSDSSVDFVYSGNFKTGDSVFHIVSKLCGIVSDHMLPSKVPQGMVPVAFTALGKDPDRIEFIQASDLEKNDTRPCPC